jgi:hypothetical protein
MFTLEQTTKTQEGIETSLYSFFNLGTRSRWVLRSTHRPIYSREWPGTHFIEGWVGPRAGLDGCGKSRLTTGFDPRTVHPVPTELTRPTLYYELSRNYVFQMHTYVFMDDVHAVNIFQFGGLYYKSLRTLKRPFFVI